MELPHKTCLVLYHSTPAWMLRHVRLFVTLWTTTLQSPLPMEFSWQEYWSGLLFPHSGDLPSPGIKPASPMFAGRFFTAEPPGKAILSILVEVVHLLLVNKLRKYRELGLGTVLHLRT